MHASLKSILAAGALLIGAAACDIEPELAPPFAPTSTGEVTGQVFFDANGDGIFDLLAGDSLVTSGDIEVSARGDSANVIARGTLGAEGRFSIADVPIGSYDVRAFPTGQQALTCAPVVASVFIGEAAFASTPVRVSCRIDAAVAKRRALNSVITVGGIVTAVPGVYRATNLYMQDSSGCIQVFGVPGGVAIAEGDSIEVTGRLGQFGQERQVSPVTSLRVVTPGAGTIDPRERTIAQLLQESADLAAVDSFAQYGRTVGELVVLRAVRFVDLPANNTAGSPGATDLTVEQGTRRIAVRLDQNVNTTVPVSSLAGANRCFDIVGILGFFNPILQLKPRGPADITPVTCPAS